MESSDRIAKLLEEIRDAHRDSLEEYRKVTSESLELQRDAVSRQAQFGKIYRISLTGAAILIAGIIVLIIYLLLRILSR